MNISDNIEEIAWKREWFQTKKDWGFWNKVSNHRLVLDQFAKSHGIFSFDGWKNITANDFVNYGLRSLLDEYKGSVRNSLLEVYKGISRLYYLKLD